MSVHNSTPFKYQWARYIARKSLEDDLAAVKNRIRNALDANKSSGILNEELTNENTSIAHLLKVMEPATGSGTVPAEQGKIKVGIVGAGVAGLFTAMLLDWLNEKVKGLSISYDIFEAAGEDRLGGRLYTHEFSKKDHDYYDVGAMRFPDNAVMKRTFQLFELIKLRKEPGGLIQYLMSGDEKVLPSYFNDMHKVGNPWTAKGEDIYDLNTGFPDDQKIPEDIFKQKPDEIVATALKEVVQEVQRRLELYEKNKQEGKPQDPKDDPWTYLMQTDNMSVRQYLSTPRDKDGDGVFEFPGYNYNTIEWLESATYGTGWYDQALSECVLEELDFSTENGDQSWFCVEGGAQKIARMMRKTIQGSVQLNSRVLAIDAHPDPGMRKPKEHTPITLKIKQTNPYTKKERTFEEDYFTVFNSTTLPALQRMDLRKAGLLWGTKQAIRALGYGASCKVAIKFSTPWWRLEPFSIKGGVSRTDLPLRVCVYPSYNINDHTDESAVLLCSYTWGQDAQRLGSLISNNTTPQGEEELKRVLLHDLALLHGNESMPYEKLHELLGDQYLTHHAWDWYRDENMSGAFAYFGPGQFSNMWEEIIKPNAFGQLYLVGEAASSHHAWVVGALESVVRAVYLMIKGLSLHDPGYQPYQIAMKLLEEDSGTEGQEDNLPFHPLPLEMPNRQQKTERNAPTTDDPQEADELDKDLTFAAGMIAQCLIESFLELSFGVKG